MKEILELIIRSFVNHPEDVKIDETKDNMGIVYTIKAHPKDMGLIIGRQGDTIIAIRKIMKIVGYHNHANVGVKFYDLRRLG